MSSRNMSVAGTFYPSECSEIERYIQTFNQAVSSKKGKLSARAIISPHAGYVYSGFSANAAYSLVDTQGIKRVVLIGPSHRVYLKGASVALYEEYLSPCSKMKMDMEYSKALIERYELFSFDPSAHAEHSTETQVPFIQHYFGPVDLVEIVYGDIDYAAFVPLIEELLKDEESFLVISTDLSHFYTLEEAKALDSICLKAVEDMDMKGLDSGCEACGKIGVKALVQAAENLGLGSRVVDYRTSYDASSDASRVVGYMSALIV